MVDVLKNFVFVFLELRKSYALLHDFFVHGFCYLLTFLVGLFMVGSLYFIYDAE